MWPPPAPKWSLTPPPRLTVPTWSSSPYRLAPARTVAAELTGVLNGTPVLDATNPINVNAANGWVWQLAGPTTPNA